MRAVISMASIGETPAYLADLPSIKVEIIDGHVEASFALPLRLTTEETKAVHAQEADKATLHKYDRIVDSGLDVLEATGFQVKVTNYGCWGVRDEHYVKMTVGHAGRAYLRPVSKKSWTSNGRFTTYLNKF